MGVKAISSFSAPLGKIGAVAIVVDLSNSSSGNVRESDAEAERDRHACVGSNVGPVDGRAVITAGALPGPDINGWGGGHKRC